MGARLSTSRINTLFNGRSGATFLIAALVARVLSPPLQNAAMGDVAPMMKSTMSQREAWHSKSVKSVGPGTFRVLEFTLLTAEVICRAFEVDSIPKKR